MTTYTFDQTNWQAPDDVALLRVDAQEAFGPRGKGLGHPEGDDIVPVLNRLHTHFKKRADTRDRHPAVGHISMASTHNIPPYSEIMTSYGPQTAWPDHALEGTFEVDYLQGLVRSPADAEIFKGTNINIDSYSGFRENDRQTQPRMENGQTLAEHFNAQGVKKLVLGGLLLSHCVGWTALDAVNEGFEVVIVEEATRTLKLPQGDSDTDTIMRRQLSAAGVTITTEAELPYVLGVLKRRPSPAPL